MEETPGRWLALGKVLRPHGLGGLMRVSSQPESEALFLQSGTARLRRSDGEERDFRVLSAKPFKHLMLLQLQGVDTREAAETLQGAEILLEAGRLSREPQEFFWQELLGLGVYQASGEYLGALDDIIPTPGHDIYVVRHGEREFLLPATAEVVREIRLGKREMIVDAGEELLGLNEI